MSFHPRTPDGNSGKDGVATVEVDPNTLLGRNQLHRMDTEDLMASLFLSRIPHRKFIGEKEMLELHIF